MRDAGTGTPASLGFRDGLGVEAKTGDIHSSNPEDWGPPVLAARSSYIALARDCHH